MKIVFRFLSLCLLLIISESVAYAQYFNTGQDPASISWQQINTKDFQIIFPAAYEHKARYMAAVFQDLLAKGGKDLQHQPKKFSVILHTYNATTNGMVAWAPKRMEVFTTSAQDNDAQLWIDHVATHEYRHVIQLDKIEQGFTRVLNYIFGQQATAVVVGLYLPPWFLEGDAVCTETALSASGRGRFPAFEQELRAQLLEKGMYSYDKAVNGSYADFITDRYKLGYYLVGKARTNYGDQLWENTLNRVARRPLGITSFASGIKKGMQANRDVVFQQLQAKQEQLIAQGVNVEKIDWQAVKAKHADGKLLLYADVMKELEWDWKVQDAKTIKSQFVPLSNREQIYTNKRYPHVKKNGSIIVYRRGLADEGYFESLNQAGIAAKLFTPGFIYYPGFDYQQGKLLWAEQKDNIRWEKSDKSILVTYNAQTHKRRTYKTANSCFAPAYSPNGNQIIAVEIDKSGNNTLVVLNEESGQIVKRYPAKEEEYFITPKWMPDGKSIVMILLNKQGKQLVAIDLATGDRKTLFESGKHDMSQVAIGGDNIFFTAAFSGIDNIYAYQLSNGKVWQVTSSRFGATDACWHNHQLYYSDYTSDGYIPVKIDLNKANWSEWNNYFASFPLAAKLSDQLGEKMAADTTNLNRFTVKNYSKLTHLFNFHSWAPVFIDGLDAKSDIGVSLASQNKLSTLMTTVGYKKEEGFENGQYYANMSYRGWFPIIDSKLTVGDRNNNYLALANRISPSQVDTVLVNTAWRQWEWENSIRFPFTLSKGQFTSQIIPKITYNYVKFADTFTQPLAIYSNTNLALGQYNITDRDQMQQIMEYQLFAYNIAKSSSRDVQYRWAQILEFNYRHTLFGDASLGETWSAESYLYFPGFQKHQGIKLYGGYQYRSSHNSRYANMIKSPRGTQDLFGENIYMLGIDYAMPLFYPDWNLGALAYIKRIKFDAFFDYGYEQSKIPNGGDQLFNSVFDSFSFGGELSSDMHVLRFPAPVNFGLRLGYESQSNGVFASFLLSFALNSF